MTYIGAKDMKGLIGKADFIEITNSGIEESRAHGCNNQ
jgi:IMP dehydrogenase/GMP reductase